MVAAQQIKVVRLQALRLLNRRRPPEVTELKRFGNRPDDGPRNVVLNGEYVLELTLVRFRPDHRIFFDVNELRRHSQTIASATNACLQQKAHVQAKPDFPERNVSALECIC